MELHRFRIFTLMHPLPDFEAWAVFAKVAETGSFAAAATELGLSKPTVSKAVTRLETKLGLALFHRTSRRLSLTESGQAALERASHLLAEGEALEAEAAAQSATPRGRVRMAAPMSFGIQHLGPAIAAFMAEHPAVSIDLNLDDRRVDLVRDGFDLGLRIAALADSSLRVRRLCEVRRLVVAAPAYWERMGGIPRHPDDLRNMTALAYAQAGAPPAPWRFRDIHQREVTIAVPAPLRADNADLLLPVLRAGLGVSLLPEFLVWRDLQQGLLTPGVVSWTAPEIALHLVTPPSRLRPARVTALMDFLAARFARAPWTMNG